MRSLLQFLSLLAMLTFLPARSSGRDDTPAAPKADASKKDKETKPAKDEPEYNQPPKGAVLFPVGPIKGRITKGSDGKTFSMEIPANGKVKEVEINLAATTKVRVVKVSEFDDKGNARKPTRVVSNGTADDLRGGLYVTVTLSGTRDGSWLVLRTATVAGE
jgi:hypothetical protein